MFSKLSTISITLALFASTVMGSSCHVESSVSHRQNSACGYGSCISGDTFTGGVDFYIDGSLVDNPSDIGYDQMSDGSGADINSNGISFHVDPLGLPDAGNPPLCQVHIGDYVNLGIGSNNAVGLPGVVGNDMSCVHDWDC